MVERAIILESEPSSISRTRLDCRQRMIRTSTVPTAAVFAALMFD
jgi:hypothetical protein